MKTILLFIVLSSAFFSCKKEGCTKPSASNYDPSAKKDDNSCKFQHLSIIESEMAEKLGVYSVSDSIVDFSQTVYFSNYSIEIKLVSIDPYQFVLCNYANQTNLLHNAPLEVACTIVGDSIFIPSQFIEGDNIPGLSFNDFQINIESGNFVNDSLFLNLGYGGTNGDIYYGSCWGKKD